LTRQIINFIIGANSLNKEALMPLRKPEIFRETRERAGLSIQDVALKAGLGWGTVQAIETGRMPGKMIDRTKLAEALHLPLRYAMTSEETEAMFRSTKEEQQRKRERVKRAAK
jgi:transcriptional regulator with XRE-family HTH domain